MYNKIGIFPGEYSYHNLAAPDKVTTDLSQADIIIISHPFSADGMSSHEKIKHAETYNKPIFIDCAFYGICHDINFDFSSYKNIHSVCFSLSKSLGTGRHRVGLLYTIDKYPASIYNEWQYPLLSSAEYHYALIDMIKPDTLVDRYLDQQVNICARLNLVASNTIIFGLDYSERYQEFRRGYVNRVCISNLFN